MRGKEGAAILHLGEAAVQAADPALERVDAICVGRVRAIWCVVAAACAASWRLEVEIRAADLCVCAVDRRP